ncbi:Outer membrane protein beta-barrel domain-containing protein [Chitinophaga sancti]|uniref:Outer membrane protein beta-barrel domain-containing protein n=2 Tax=Chitinophaga sancti TaxID=1004 RepID=A0A1K1S9H9_9BACT|nr:Outer membrane protein beta-barrel domain-containing protein [Chitinophaga sancti]
MAARKNIVYTQPDYIPGCYRYMKNFYLPLLCCLATINSLAQRNFVPGAVAVPQRDSLKGFIDFRNWTSTPNEIRFKSTENGEITTYTPNQISGFALHSDGDVVYVTKHVLLDVTPYIVSSTQSVTQPQTELLDSIVFIQQLVTGAYNLYTYTDRHQRIHFMYNAPGGDIQELKYIKTMVPSPDGGKIYEKKEYQEQLTSLFKDEGKIARQARSVDYRDEDLIALFVAYQHAKAPGTEVLVKTKKKQPIYFGIVAGPAFNSYNWKGGEQYMLHGKYSSSVNPIAGVFVDIPLGGATRQWSMYNELLYKTYSTHASMDMNALLAGDIATFKFSYLQLNVMAQYIYPKGVVKPFVHIGMGNAIIVKTTTNDYFDASRPEHREAFAGPRKLEQLLVGGIGVRADRFQLEVRGSTSTGWIDIMSASMPVNSLQIIAGVRF